MWSFIKICLICIIGKNRMKEIFHRKTQNIYFKILLAICSCSKNLSSFWLKLKQQWIIEEIPIFSNSSHLEWRAELSDTILKWNYPRTTPAKFGLIWFSSFREVDLNVIFFNKICLIYIICIKRLTEKNSQKNPQYMLNYSLQCSCS